MKKIYYFLVVLLLSFCAVSCSTKPIDVDLEEISSTRYGVFNNQQETLHNVTITINDKYTSPKIDEIRKYCTDYFSVQECRNITGIPFPYRTQKIKTIKVKAKEGYMIFTMEE